MTGKEKIDYMKGRERLKNIESYFKNSHNVNHRHLKETLITYEWHLPTDQDVAKNVCLLFSCLEHRSSFFPITEKLFNMFNGIRKYINDFTHIFLYDSLSVFKFAIDLGYVKGFYIIAEYYTTNDYRLNYAYYEAIKLGVFLQTWSWYDVEYYIRRVMITG